MTSKLGFFLVCLFAISASGQGITQVATLPVNTAFVVTGQYSNGISFLTANWQKNELYVSYTGSIQVIDTGNNDPRQWSRKPDIPLAVQPWGTCVSNNGTIGVIEEPSPNGAAAKSPALTLIDPTSGQQRVISLGNSFGSEVLAPSLEPSPCVFSPDGKIVYTQGLLFGQLGLYAVDVSMGTIVQRWNVLQSLGVPPTYPFGQGLSLAAMANGKVYGIIESGYFLPPYPLTPGNIATSVAYSLVVFNPDGSENTVDTGLLPQYNTHLLNSDPNGSTMLIAGWTSYKNSQTLLAPTLLKVDSNSNQVVATIAQMPSFLAWPSNDPNFAYMEWEPHLNALNLAVTTQNRVFSDFTIPGVGPNNDIHGLLARRLADGSDQIVALRDGEVDVDTATQPPLVYSVVNGASFQAVPLAPGENITIFGSALGYVGQADSTGLQILTTMGATSVLLDGKPIRLNYVSDRQINAYMPQNVANGTHSLSVKVGTSTISQQITVVDQNLALFQFIPDPVRVPGVFFPILMDAGYYILGDPTVLNPGGQPFGYAQVARGDVAIAWATGGGITVPPISDSDISPGGLHPLVITPPMTACGVPVAIQYSGRGPGFPSLDQFNFVVPSVCQTGANDLTLGTLTYKGVLWVK